MQPDQESELYQRNMQWAKPQASHQTQLSPEDEQRFLSWVQEKAIPFDPKDGRQDYDMRGYWQKLLGGLAPGARKNPVDGLPHYPDTFKTPYHKSFSAESQYAKPNAPVWVSDSVLMDPATGAVVFDEKAAR